MDKNSNAKNTGEIMQKIVSDVLLLLLRLYKILLSPLLGPACRYVPSCSEYAAEAIKKHGPLKGFWLALKRLLSCHPWGGSGYDPVP